MTQVCLSLHVSNGFENNLKFFLTVCSMHSAIFGGNFTQIRQYSSSGKIGKVECRKNNV
jgi:hypothetical protein